MINRFWITDKQNNIREPKDFIDNEIGIRLQWEYGQKQNEYQPEYSDRFLAALSPSKKEIILIESTNGKTSNILKIINSDGSLRFNLKPPSLTSDAFKKYLDKVGEKEAMDSLRYVQLGESLNKTTITIWIGFDWDWFEVKEFNLVTGEFGASKITGRL